MMGATLVVMAAGLGSRYGCLKQIDRIGPSGETLMEYSIFDAMVAGFNKVVFVVRPGMEASLRSLCGDRISRYMDVTYVVQSNSTIPQYYSIPERRIKPFGTVHALLSARNVVSEPFAILNADDFYGFDAFRHMFDAICDLPPIGKACMPGYLLKNTLSPYGNVCRGICDVRYKKLVSIREERSLKALPDGSVQNNLSDALLDPNSIVSMNFWGFTPWIFDYAEQYFDSFISSLLPDDVLSECILTDMIARMINSGELVVSVLPTNSQWFGVTYPDDKAVAQERLSALVVSRDYPSKLFV